VLYQAPRCGAPYTSTLGVMTRTRVTVLVAGVFIAGVVVGGGLAAWLYDRFVLSNYVAMSAASGVGNKLTVLRAVRTGDTNGAVQSLELSLDGDLVTLGLLPSSTIDGPTSRILNRVASYREEYPHKFGDAEVDTAIAELLHKYKTTGAGATMTPNMALVRTRCEPRCQFRRRQARRTTPR
jgi:hypothetical protein